MRRITPKAVLMQLLLWVSVIVFVTPLYLTLVNSLKGIGDIQNTPFSLPDPVTIINYTNVLTTPNVRIMRLFLNSVIITSFSVLCIMIFAPLAAYYMARDKKHGPWLLLYFILGMMVPSHLTLIPVAQIYSQMGLLGTYHGLILFYLGTSVTLALFLYVNFIKTIPIQIEEAAVIDGASRRRIFWQILFPILKPCTATVVIFNSLNVWNDFLHPLILMQGTPRGHTITLGIFSAMGPYVADWGFVFAFVTLATLPIVILFLMMQEQFINGLTTGSVKG